MIASAFKENVLYKKGTLLLEFVSWENDGDNYQYNYLFADSKEELIYFRKLRKRLKGANLENETYNYGAVSDIIDDLLDKGEITSPFVFKHFYNHGEEDNDLLSQLHKFYGCPEDYENDFIRVMEGIKLFELQEDFIRKPNNPVVTEIKI